jgi:hypothetical protein
MGDGDSDLLAYRHDALAQHRFDELGEERRQIARAGTRLGMPLEAERWTIGAGDALQRTVEQRPVCRADIGRQRRLVDREAGLAEMNTRPSRSTPGDWRRDDRTSSSRVGAAGDPSS